MKRYKRISYEERVKIYIFNISGYNQTIIAKILGRHKSTISNELKRCREDPGGYLPDIANLRATNLNKRNTGLLKKHPKLQDYVENYLREGWSPEIIANRLKQENAAISVSHETIYRHVYSEEGQEKKLSLHLPRRKPKRTAKYGKKPRKSHIPASASIHCRPKSINKRKKIGHWEGDLVVFTSLKSANVTTLVERKSRYAKLVHNTDKYTKTVISGINKSMQNIPEKYRKTIAFDRGSEFAAFKDLNMQTYFCDPHSPWQKGSNENFNGRLRRYLPKSYNPRNLSQILLDQIEFKMNNQPRKCLGFKTPFEVLFNTKIATAVALGP
jgi:IS30 family transposase